MALDNPVFPLGSRGWWRNSRAIELAVVVGLTVAVVAVAAQWGGSSLRSDEPVATSLEATIPVSAVEAVEVARPIRAEASAVTTSAVEVETETVVASVQPASPPVEPQAQTGIVPGRPDPLDPATPDSFERYQVQRGESLHSIASARGITVSDLIRWNWHLSEDTTLIRGEWIWIPGWSVPAVADESNAAADEGKSGRGGG